MTVGALPLSRDRILACAVEVADRDGHRQVWAVARSPAIRKAGLYILVGRSKDGLVAAANRRLYEDMAILAVASLLLLAGIWILATVSIGRQVGRLAAMAKRVGDYILTYTANVAPRSGSNPTLPYENFGLWACRGQPPAIFRSLVPSGHSVRRRAG